MGKKISTDLDNNFSLLAIKSYKNITQVANTINFYLNISLSFQSEDILFCKNCEKKFFLIHNTYKNKITKQFNFFFITNNQDTQDIYDKLKTTNEFAILTKINKDILPKNILVEIINIFNSF